MKPLRVMLVDDNVAFLAVAHHLLSAEPAVEIVAQCRSGGDAFAHARLQRPDLVVMDAMMPGMNGLDATRLLKAHAPRLRVILTSLHDHAALHASAASVGAECVLNKADFAQALPRVLARPTRRVQPC